MCPTEFLSLSGSQIGHCSGRKFDVPPFREQHRCPMVGQALRCLQIGDQGRNFVPILDGCVHSVRKSGADLCPTFTTLARMCTVFGYKKRWWFRNVKYLSGRDVISFPYWTGAFTPSGKAARTFAPHSLHWHVCARCSVTKSGGGLGMSNTCLDENPTSDFESVALHSWHWSGAWSTIWSGFSTWFKVVPL